MLSYCQCSAFFYHLFYPTSESSPYFQPDSTSSLIYDSYASIYPHFINYIIQVIRNIIITDFLKPYATPSITFMLDTTHRSRHGHQGLRFYLDSSLLYAPSLGYPVLVSFFPLFNNTLPLIFLISNRPFHLCCNRVIRLV